MKLSQMRALLNEFDIVDGLVLKVTQIQGLEQKCISTFGWKWKNAVSFQNVTNTSQTRYFFSIYCLKTLANTLRVIFENQRASLHPSIPKRFHECSSIFQRACVFQNLANLWVLRYPRDLVNVLHEAISQLFFDIQGKLFFDIQCVFRCPTNWAYEWS